MSAGRLGKEAEVIVGAGEEVGVGLGVATAETLGVGDAGAGVGVRSLALRPQASSSVPAKVARAANDIFLRKSLLVIPVFFDIFQCLLVQIKAPTQAQNNPALAHKRQGSSVPAF